MKGGPYLPKGSFTHIYEKIVNYAKDTVVAKVLRNYLHEETRDMYDSCILIYGQIQGGKTKEIVRQINSYQGYTMVVQIQNSILVLEQYKATFESEGIEFQVISKDTEAITKPVVLLMNNVYKHRQFLSVEPREYILFIDEFDQRGKNAKRFDGKFKTVCISATPFTRLLFDRIIEIPANQGYHGINDLTVNNSANPVADFLSKGNGMMLVSKFIRVKQMEAYTEEVSEQYPDVPVVLLNSVKKLYLNGKIKILKGAISSIVDSLSEYGNIIFVANRLASRGLSYVSSDYKRHLTYQYADVKKNLTVFYQSLRILGIYEVKCELTLTIDESQNELFQIHLDKVNSFDVRKKLKPRFWA